MAFKVLSVLRDLAIILFQKVKKQVKPQEDGVRFYWISQEAVSIVLVIPLNRLQMLIFSRVRACLLGLFLFSLSTHLP